MQGGGGWESWVIEETHTWVGEIGLVTRGRITDILCGVLHVDRCSRWV